MPSLDGKVALVNGCGTLGQGWCNGKAPSVLLPRQGSSVYGCDIELNAAEATRDLSRSEGGTAEVQAADVTQAAAVQQLIDACVSQFGRIDILINNAGIGAPGVPLDELPIETWKQVVDTNLNGMFYALQQAFRVMKTQSPRGGRIINNGSISAYAPRPNSIAYTATKHAVTGLTRTASLDGRKHDIAVGQIDIGNALTELAARMGKGVPQANGEVAVEPLMDAAVVGQSILYMANLPLEANVLFHTVMATKMPFVGRG
ncbi:MAG: SDR family oxidoreductase [Ramlibacter sp.]